MTSRRRALGIALLGVLLGLGTVRLATGARWLAQHGLQADFSAYYIAGKSLNRGLSPYRNHAAQDASLWDGVDLWQPSRFLYPPLAALPFRALGALPYGPAKAMWTGLTFVLAAAALLLSARASRCRSVVPPLVAALWLVVGWPFLLELERGQIDLLTLVLVLGAALLQRRPGRGWAVLAGGLWALAALFKLHVVLALPFLLLRRRLDVALGAVLAGAGLLVVSTVAMPGATSEYLTQVMPRMLRHGVSPAPDSELPPAVLGSLFSGYPAAVAHAHGESYLRFAMAFDDHASLVWALAGEQPKYPGLLSVLVAGLMVGGVGLALRRAGQVGDGNQRGRAREPSQAPGVAVEDLAWLVLALCCVLLAAPLTWPMNAVWLLPAVFVLLAPSAPGPAGGRRYYRIGIGLVGLLLVALPDRFAWPWPRSLSWLSGPKYVLGEVAVALAMIACLAARSDTPLPSVPEGARPRT